MTSEDSKSTHRSQTAFLTMLAMLAFASNSILARIALKFTEIDAASFTTIRLTSGAAMLWIIVRLSSGVSRPSGNWPSALALFVYAAAFSFAYLALPTATGALLLFGAVQATMILAGLRAGERLGLLQTTGIVLALAGLVYLLLPGLSAPPLDGAATMIAAGIAWGIYSLRGRGTVDSANATTGNFLRAAPIAIVMSLVMLPALKFDGVGAVYALLSGAIASGLGYVVWYSALRGLNATRASTVQLSVPIIASVGGIVLLGEPITSRLVIASVAILGGIGLVFPGQVSGSKEDKPATTGKKS